MALQKSTLLECIGYLIGRSCWTKLFSQDPNDRKRLESIETGLKALQGRLKMVDEFARRTGNAELQRLLTEFEFRDHK